MVRRFCRAFTALDQRRCSDADLFRREGFSACGCNDGAFASAGVDAAWQAHDARGVGDRLVGLGIWCNDLDRGCDATLQVREGGRIRLLAWSEKPVVMKRLAAGPNGD